MNLEDLIGNLESALEATERYEFDVASGQPPRRATYRVTSTAIGQGLARNTPTPAEVHRANNEQVIFHSRDNILKNSKLELALVAAKSSQGETVYMFKLRALDVRKTSGSYVIGAAVESLKKVEVAIAKRFQDCVWNENYAAWNAWCADLDEGPDLRGLDLAGANLAYYDLCCANLAASNLRGANLTGANLGGANLSGCDLENVSVAGADLFRCQLPRKFMGLVAASGMLEVESVILV